MVKHIVMWSFREEITQEERVEAAKKIKEGLEGLVGVVPGLTAAYVVTDPIASSSHNLALVSELETREDLVAYKDNPDHVRVATFVRSVTCNRAALDYEV